MAKIDNEKTFENIKKNPRLITLGVYLRQVFIQKDNESPDEKNLLWYAMKIFLEDFHQMLESIESYGSDKKENNGN